MRRQSLKNDAGEPISGIRRLKQEAYGTGKTSGGEAVIDWERWKTPYADEHGLDIRNIEETGTYWIALVLPQDTRIIRYGPETGRFTAPEGTDYDALSLPYDRETVEFHKYQVTAQSITVYCKVQKGIVAPMFDSEGGAVQYYHPNANMRELIKAGILERVAL